MEGYLLTIVSGVVDEVAEGLEFGAVRQFDDQCVCNVLCVGCLSDNEGVAQQRIGLPFDVVVGLDFGDFGAYGADDVSRNPSGLLCAGFSISMALSTLHGLLCDPSGTVGLPKFMQPS